MPDETPIEPAEVESTPEVAPVEEAPESPIPDQPESVPEVEGDETAPAEVEAPAARVASVAMSSEGGAIRETSFRLQ